MCGLAGFVEGSGRRRADELTTFARHMADALCHRGPDDAGTWVEPETGVALGFRRLAIIDLTAAGHQPQLSHDGRYAIVFNGEIYNHLDLRRQLEADGGERRWNGHSDTETLLACVRAWGVRTTLERTVGMFALALWDRADRRLYLARDRFGEKPLYYGWSSGAFVFGSELHALRRYPAFDNDIDRDVLALYLQYCAVPAPYSIYRGIYKLQPGCLLSMPLDAVAQPPSRALFAPARHESLTIERYWSIEQVAAQSIANPFDDETEAVEQVEAALVDAVRLQSIADVPLGAFLSGGIDSSLIVALMQAHSASRVRTFTIGFEEEGYNEAEHAKAVAKHLGTDHTELYVTGQQALDVVPRLPQVYSEPFADSSQVPTHLVSHVARQHVTVALSGDGGDELFGGYIRYLWGPRIWNRMKWLPAPMRRGVATTIRGVPLRQWDILGRTLPPGIAGLGDKAHKLARHLMTVNDVDGLYRMLVSTWPADADVVPSATRLATTLDYAAAPPPDIQQRMMLWDSLTYLPDDILHKVDRASMAVSLETRAPFLDHRVAALAWRLPLHMKIRNGTTKWLLRQLLYKFVPPSLIERPKMGFGIPVDAWLRGPLRDWAEGLLAERRLAADGYFDPAPIRRKWAEHLSGERNWQYELWCVLMFQVWLEHR